MLKAIFRPIQKWPGKPTPSQQQKDGRFKASYAATLELLEKELCHLKAKDTVIQAYFELGQIRNDGWPRSSARPTQPGVVLTYYVKGEAFSFPCDTYSWWEDNLRAIGLSLEALRTVNRYGVTQGSEQYQGFKRLEAPVYKSKQDEAYEFIAKHSGATVQGARTDVDGCYRTAARKLHPDLGGSHELFVKLQEKISRASTELRTAVARSGACHASIRTARAIRSKRRQQSTCKPH